MRTIRLDIETREKSFLSPAASFSSNSKGCQHPREEDDIRTLYMQDRDRIIHSEYFRRLKDKAQVIMLSVGDFRTRLTHTLEVMQIARSIARVLRLNEDLTEAIALGHDLGHPPLQFIKPYRSIGQIKQDRRSPFSGYQTLRSRIRTFAETFIQRGYL